MSLQLVLASAEVTSAAEEAGSGRAGSVAALLLGILGVAVGVLAIAQAHRRVARNGLPAALLSLALGLGGVAASLVLLSESTGEVGTGNGRGGAIVALVVGLAGSGVGAAAAAWSRRLDRSAA